MKKFCVDQLLNPIRYHHLCSSKPLFAVVNKTKGHGQTRMVNIAVKRHVLTVASTRLRERRANKSLSPGRNLCVEGLGW